MHGCMCACVCVSEEIIQIVGALDLIFVLGEVNDKIGEYICCYMHGIVHCTTQSVYASPADRFVHSNTKSTSPGSVKLAEGAPNFCFRWFTVARLSSMKLSVRTQKLQHIKSLLWAAI